MIDTVFDFIKKLEMEFHDVTPGTLTPDSDFRNSFVWSSINALITMAFIETEYRVNVQIYELESCKDLQTLYDLVKSKDPRRN